MSPPLCEDVRISSDAGLTHFQRLSRFVCVRVSGTGQDPFPSDRDGATKTLTSKLLLQGHRGSESRAWIVLEWVRPANASPRTRQGLTQSPIRRAGSKCFGLLRSRAQWLVFSAGLLITGCTQSGIRDAQFLFAAAPSSRLHGLASENQTEFALSGRSTT